MEAVTCVMKAGCVGGGWRGLEQAWSSDRDWRDLGCTSQEDALYMGPWKWWSLGRSCSRPGLVGNSVCGLHKGRSRGCIHVTGPFTGCEERKQDQEVAAAPAKSLTWGCP